MPTGGTPCDGLFWEAPSESNFSLYVLGWRYIEIEGYLNQNVVKYGEEKRKIVI